MNKHVNKVRKATGRAEAITAGRQQNKQQYLIIQLMKKKESIKTGQERQQSHYTKNKTVSCCITPYHNHTNILVYSIPVQNLVAVCHSRSQNVVVRAPLLGMGAWLTTWKHAPPPYLTARNLVTPFCAYVGLIAKFTMCMHSTTRL